MSEWIRILLVEDDQYLAEQMRWLLKEEHEVWVSAHPKEALELMRKAKPHVVLLDLGLPPRPEDPSVGLELLGEFLGADPLVKVIVMTAHGDQETAQTAMARGAYDFLVKPVKEELLVTLIKRAFFRRELEVGFWETQEKGLPIQVVVASQAMHQVLEQVKIVAALPASCLILGETGTGKELVARLIHELSPRRSRPLVTVDCASIPITLAESELFGAEKGAYTGAEVRRTGRVAQAEGGTLFLDEIGELPLEVQVKLLRFLETRQFTPVGGRTREVDVRILAATNRDLKEEVKRGRFRLDLFHRLGQTEIRIPPLRERKEDILPLARSFLSSLAREYRMKPPPISPEGERALLEYDFPGNARELKNMLSKALILSRGRPIGPKELGLGGAEAPFAEMPKEGMFFPVDPGFDLPKARAHLEETWVREALMRNRGRIAQAAADLNLPRTTLYDLMRRYRIKEET